MVHNVATIALSCQQTRSVFDFVQLKSRKRYIKHEKHVSIGVWWLDSIYPEIHNDKLFLSHFKAMSKRNDN